MGGTPIGAEGHDPTFRGKEDRDRDRGHNLGIIHISHILLLSRLYTNVNAETISIIVSQPQSKHTN